MTNSKSQIADREIRHGDKFKAYEIATGKKAKVGEPFEAKRVTDKKIVAIDTYGCARVFPIDMWRFQIVG